MKTSKLIHCAIPIKIVILRLDRGIQRLSVFLADNVYLFVYKKNNGKVTGFPACRQARRVIAAGDSPRRKPGMTPKKKTNFEIGSILYSACLISQKTRLRHNKVFWGMALNI